MKLKFDVSAAEFATVRDILTDILPPDCRVWVFGSRAKNTARFNSDLDLAIEASQGRALSKDTLPRLKDAFNDAPLSYRVDVLDLTEVSDNFQTIIRKQAVAFPLPQTDNVPKLRFLEFKSSWKNTSLGKVSGKPAYGMNAAACEFDGKHKYIRITDISDQERAYRPKPLTSPEPPISADYALRAGDIVFTRTGASTGKSYLYKEADGELYFAGFLIRFSIKSAVPAFVFAQTLRSDYENWVSVASTRSGQPGINAQEYAGYKFSIPPLPEQRKIANFLKAADDKITQLSRKKALLEGYKKGCMQQLFSQEIRFKDNQGNDFPDWEERRLGDVFTWIRTNSLSRERLSYDNGEVQNIHYGDIHTKFHPNFRQAHENVPFIKDAQVTDFSTTEICKLGDVVIADASEDYADIGKAIEIIELAGIPLVAGLHTYVARPIAETLALGFSGYLLRSAVMRKQITRIAQGISVLGISKGNLEKLTLCVPHPDEQRKVADFLSTIDTKIGLVSQELGHAQAFKKGLLQQMFV
jgi:type I restriction enzyme S subunit